MIDYLVLKNEINLPIFNELLNNGAIAGIANILNIKNQSMLQPIPILEYAIWAAQNQIKLKLKIGLTSSNQAVSDICDTALMIMNNPHVTYLDLTDNGSMGLVNALVSATIITNDDKINLINFCTRQVSRAEMLFGTGTVIDTHDVILAKDM